MKDLIKALKSFGLEDKEAVVYLTLYRLGEATAYQVAKDSSLKRPTVYFLLDQLRCKGLVLVTPHHKKQIYQAKNPHDFIYEQNQEINNASSIILKQLPKLLSPSGKTVLFSGVEGFSQGLAYGLDGKDAIANFYAFYAGIPKGVKVSQIYLDHHRSIITKGVSFKFLIPINANDKVFQKIDNLAKGQVVRKNISLVNQKISVEIFNNITKVIFHHKKQVLIIEDESLVKLAKNMFESYWIVV